MTGPALVALFFLQVACILAACRVVGWVAAGVGQPRMVAEIATGFLLGLSWLGWIADPVYRALSPAPTLPALSSC
jgi:Kef-type K+ transport system membrane component KefB